MTKSETIKNTLKETKLRRKFQVCKSFELKFDSSHIHTKKLNELNLLFLESKWLYNHILSTSKSNNIFLFDTKINKVNTLDKDKNPVTKDLNIIGSQIKQSILSRMLDSICSLAKLREKGYKIGKLKFKSKVNSIPLKQYDITYKFNKEKPNYVKIQGLKGYYKVNGTRQIPINAEFANATLIKKNNNFYLKVTCYVNKKQKIFKEKEIGIDFGIESTITLSNGEKIKVNIPENDRTRKLRKRLARKIGSKKKQKKSKRYLKNLVLLNKSITKTTNQKKDIKNKIISYLVNNFETICVQDESIKEWKDGNYGKEVHNSILGGIMKDLKNKSNTLNIVEKYTPTTQVCPNCFKLNKFETKVRIYKCECGYIEERDIHAAKNILNLGIGRMSYDRLNKVFMDDKHSKFLMESMASSADNREVGSSKLCLKKLEAPML